MTVMCFILNLSMNDSKFPHCRIWCIAKESYCASPTIQNILLIYSNKYDDDLT